VVFLGIAECRVLAVLSADCRAGLFKLFFFAFSLLFLEKLENCKQDFKQATPSTGHWTGISAGAGLNYWLALALRARARIIQHCYAVYAANNPNTERA